MSKVFKEVLNTIDGLLRDILKLKDLEFKDIPPEIANDVRYMAHFQVSQYVLIHLYIDIYLVTMPINYLMKNCFILGLHWSY